MQFMTFFELRVLAWGCVLGLVHIFATSQVRTRQYGRAWNVGARDEKMPPLKPLAGRLLRAQGNYFETFPVMAAALLIVAILSLSSGLTRSGALIWLAARIVYLPLYGFGVPVVRTIVWGIGFIGILLVLQAPIRASFLL